MTWKLTGKPDGAGQCEHCPRALKHRYEITAADGRKMIVGRGCLKKVTGWTLTAAEAERQIRCMAVKAARDARWAAFTTAHPEMAAAIQEDVDDYCARVPRSSGFGAGAASEVKLNISDGSPGFPAEEYAARYMARRGEVAEHLHRMFPSIRYVRDAEGVWQEANWAEANPLAAAAIRIFCSSRM